MSAMISKMCGRRSVLVGVLLASFAGASGCAGSSSYAIPEKVCNRPIEPTALKPLLPEGEEVKGQRRGSGDEYETCAVVVDRNVILLISEYRDQNRFDIVGHTKERQSTDDPVESEVPGDSIIFDGGFVSMNPCPARGEKSNYILEISLMRSPSDDKKLRKELEAFAASYLPAGLKAMGCVK